MTYLKVVGEAKHEGFSTWSGLAHTMNARHRAQIAALERTGHVRVETQTVRCHTFDGLLQKHGLSGVDLVSMDCEGCEYAVLSSIDNLRALGVTAWVIEGRGEAARPVRRLMKRHGYFVGTEIGLSLIHISEPTRPY